MMMILDHETLDLDGCSLDEVIAVLQTWQTENFDAVNTNFNLLCDEESTYAEINFHRPMTEIEIGVQKIQRANADQFQETRDRLEYDRLKAKFEGN